MLLLPSERKLVKPTGRYVLNKDSRQAIGLVAWYPFTPGARLIDHAGVGAYDLDPTNSPVITTDKDFGDVGDMLTSSNQRWNAQVTPITTYGVTMTAWHNKDNSTDVTYVLQLYNSGDTGQFMGMMARGSGEMRARKDGLTGTAQNADDATGYTVGNWDFGAAIFTSSTYSAIKCNNRSRVTNTTDTGSVTVNGFAVGVDMFSSPRSWYGGLIGDVRLYNRELSDAELDEQWHPNTRFELYYEIGKKVYFFFTSGGGGGPPPSLVTRKTLLRVGI